MNGIENGGVGARLGELVAALGGLCERRGACEPDRLVSGVSSDSRQIGCSSIFVAVRGFSTDGHLHIESAIKAGAAAVVCESLPAELRDNVCYLRVTESRKALAELSRIFYGNASEQLMLIGVTGTNGKTTTARLITSMLNASGVAAGYIGTGLCRIGDRDIPLERTTPESNDLHALFRQMVDAGCRAAVMEVSSHALVLDRVHGLFFRAAVFTNLTPEHLDFHETMERYAAAKRLLFERLTPDGFGVVNANDPQAAFMADGLPAERRVCCSLADASSLCDSERRFRAVLTASMLEGSMADVIFGDQSASMHVPLPGEYNVMNMLEAFAVGISLGLDSAKALAGLAESEAVPGRMERIWSADRSRCGVIDYAHTPDALQKALETLRAVTPFGSKLSVVFGCGGNRDRKKRPVMGRIAAELADRVIVTSDNPRDESPEAILDEVEAGMAGRRRAHLRIADRAEAIRRAVEGLGTGDILLVAGKGHEEYQEVAGRRHHFSDRETLAACFAEVPFTREVKEQS